MNDQLLPALTLAALTAVCTSPRQALATDDDPYGESAVPASPSTAELTSPRLLHGVVTEGRQRSAVSISVASQNDRPFDRLVLAYRRAGTAEFLGRVMREAGTGLFVAEIPASATTGRDVAYFVEAQDREGRVLAAHGSAEQPLVIALLPPETGTVERLDEEVDDEEEGAVALDLSSLRLYVGLSIGSGFGWASGHGELNSDAAIDPPGFAAAKFGHLAPEFGARISPALMLSVQGRFQVVSGVTDVMAGGRTYQAANYAAALFGKATWFFGRRRLQPTFSLAAGVGRIRHVVSLPQLSDCGPGARDSCVDTAAAGPLLAGAGGGLVYLLDRRLRLVAQANSQVGTPDFTVNVDLSFGIAAQF